MTSHIDNYDDLTVEEVISELDELDQSEIADVLNYEEENDERVTIIREIHDRIDGEQGGDVHTDGEVEGTDEETEEDEGEERGDVSDAPEEVTLRCSDDGYHAGQFWDEAGERTVTYTRRIRQAVENDRALEVVEDV